MADMYLYNQEDDVDDGDGAFGDPDVTMSPDEPPVSKLEKYADSDNIYNRQIVARTVLETLRAVTDDADVAAVLTVMNKLADDAEPNVRAELMEQVPHIAMYCLQYQEELEHVVPHHLLPMVVKFLTDDNNQVRKTSQAALLVLLEQGLVATEDVKEQVCPVIIRLTEAESVDDYRTEAVALLSKMAPLIGKEMCEHIFLERFAALCVDPLFHVRQVCAANFGDFSAVVGSESTEHVLLPKFFYLCEDVVWGVRKACADAFMPLSCVCSPPVRHNELSPLFVNLLRDESRWVRMAAYQALGHFISTFADPAIMGLLQNDSGEIVIIDPEKMANRLNELEEQRAAEAEKARELRETLGADGTSAAAEEEQLLLPPPEEPLEAEASSQPDDDSAPAAVEASEEEAGPSSCDVEPVIVAEGGDRGESDAATRPERVSMELCDGSEEGKQNSSLLKCDEEDLSWEEVRARSYVELKRSSKTAEEAFNNFQYWREPLMQLVATPALQRFKEEQAVDSAGGGGSEDDGASDHSDDCFAIMEPLTGPDETGGKVDDAGDGAPKPETIETTGGNGGGSNGNWGELNPMPDPALPKGPPLTIQSIVPQLLVDHYVSMVDPSRIQTVDNDIAKHCAFSLPAVALTLGRSNWPLLKNTYISLASDMQWKVRRTLASSIHELGIILGDRAEDLIPVFNGFFKDLDEVRIGLLKHLADFLNLLKVEDRQDYLPRLSEFLNMDNERNWRFRQELAEQLGHLVSMFTPREVKQHLSPITLVLIKDKVSSVRLASVEVHTIIVSCLQKSDNPSLARVFLAETADKLLKVDRWVHRQTYATLCLRIFATRAMDHSQFAQAVLPHLLDLAWDKVPNVRIVVARALFHINKAAYFVKDANPSQERMTEAVSLLAGDRDKDVRYFFNPAAPPASTSD